MEKSKNNMAIWRRSHRMPPVRNIIILCIVLVLLYHFRTWYIDYPVSSSSPVNTPSPEVPEAPGDILEDNKPADAQVETAADTPADTPSVTPLGATQSQLSDSTTGPGGIPKKIWYKLGAKGLSYDARGWTNTCVSQNPDYQVEFLTDQSADEFVKGKYADRPDIVETYLALTVPILKADLLRYLLLYAEGGVWFDLDVSCEGIPIDEWIPEEFEEDVSLVVGWEFDAGYDFIFERQFTTWTVMARKGVPHLMAVVDDIVQSMADVAKANNATISQLKMDTIGDVVEFTGPRRFADSVTKSLAPLLNETDGWDGWDDYYELLEPKLAGDVLILPGYSLAALFNTYNDEDQERVGPSLVVHHYAGSWKNEYGGERVEEQGQAQ